MSREIRSPSVLQIQQRVGPRSYRLGKQYFADGAIFDTTRLGHAIKARCRGTSGGPYRVRATIDGATIRDAHCSCPVGDGGACKHVAAMLLAFVNRPGDFAPVEALGDALQRRSKDELVALVRHMVRRHPDLESLVNVALPTAEAKAKRASSTDYRKQAASIFRAAEREEWINFDELAEQLDAIRELGDEFAGLQNHASAAAVYEGLLDEVLKHEDLIRDDEAGNLYAVVDDCVRGLGACLARAKDDARLREAALRELFHVWASDIDAGGTDLGAASGDYLVEQATPDERRMVARWARDALSRKRGRFDDWAREAYGALVAELEADWLDDEGFLRLCRETGRVEDLVGRLLKLDKTGEAIEEAQRAEDWRLPSIADLFVAAGHGDVAEGFVRRRARASKDVRLAEWLLNYCATHERDLPAALKLADELFRREPSLERYVVLRDLAQRQSAWDATRAAVLRWLERTGTFDLITRIHLHEGDPRAAVDALKLVKSSWHRAALADDVARAAEKDLPREALEIHRRRAEGLIPQRNRRAYAEACQHLRKARELHARLDERGLWNEYIRRLRDEYPRLRALHDEMAAAGLAGRT